jgi:hypothetical protein
MSEEMEFPRFVFMDVGVHPRAGGTYSVMVVDDRDALDAALANGWYASMQGAIEAPQVADNAPVERFELEAKAAELGIKFDGRTSDAKLSKMITEALEA